MKKENLLKIIGAVLLLSISSTGYGQTKVNVYQKSGTEEVIKVDETGGIYFSNDTMNILSASTASQLNTYALSNISKVTFSEGSGVSSVLAEGKMILYPNPASTVINIANASDNAQILTITNVKGQTVKTQRYTGKESINVSNLSKGLYVLNIDGQNLKFEKK